MNCDSEGVHPISLTTFKRLWKANIPDICIMKQRSDVCARCDRLRENVRHAKTEEITRLAMEQLSAHIQEADDERQYYNKSISDARDELSQTTDTDRQASSTHITFDFAQQLELPQHTRQVGLLYFKSRFKIQLFGICDEARNQQVNYLFNEAESIGCDGRLAHGPNAVISMLHHYLEKRSKEPSLMFHADNCVGQNKNRSVMAYFSWRVLSGLNTSIQISFMRVGHTRCSIDATFGCTV